ncbi:MAG: murein biosynthesis integral membrane protein MurJ [Chloroflexota bacterium]|nr:murein biosynthesis integral membrane protein MurJ [Chloroflexota bacterium]
MSTQASSDVPRRVATAASLVMVGNLASRVLGLVRDQTIAALFGASAHASIFGVISRVSTMVYDLLIGGALTAALVPVFSEYARDDTTGPALPGKEATDGGNRPDERRDRLAGALGATVGAALLVLIPVVGLLIVAAPQIMAFMGEGFAPEMQDLGMRLVRLAMPSVAMLGIASVLMAAHYARERFVRPSFATALYNVGIIGGALLLTPFFGLGGLVLGLLAGAALQCAAQSPALRGVRWRALTNFRHPALRRIVRLYAPVAGGLVVSAGVTSLDTRLASQTGAGSIAAMRYATTLVQLPLGLVATALSFATLPVLSKQAAAVVAWQRAGKPEGLPAGASEQPPDLAAYRATLALTLRLALLCIAPLTVALLVLHQPVVRLLFERGAFTADSTDITALALLFYAPQLPFVAIDQVLIAAFYALQNTRTPVLVGVVTAGLYVVVALALVDEWGMPALVFANTVQNSAHGIILAALLWRVVDGMVPGVQRPASQGPGRLWHAVRDAGLSRAALRVGVAAAAMAGVLLALDRAVLTPAAGLPVPVWGLLLVGAGVVGMSVYAGALWLLGAEDVRQVAAIGRRAWRRLSGGNGPQ